MKNITVSVDDATYHKARVRAAELGTSVSAMVRQMLNEVAGQETDRERLRRREHEIRARLAVRGRPFEAQDRLPRDELHNRDALR